MFKPLRNVILPALALSVALSGADPFVGTWKLNLAKTKYKHGQPPKSQVVTLVESGANLEVTSEVTSAEGKTYVTKYTVPSKGGDGKIIESPIFDGVKSKRRGEREREVEYLKGGKPVTTIHIVASADGKVLTGHVKGTSLTGQPVEGVTVMDKQ